jgi:hypothetical protein
MTEEELDLLTEVKDAYWLEFSSLVERTLARVPVSLRPHLEMLQESSSVYGRRTKERDDG